MGLDTVSAAWEGEMKAEKDLMLSVYLDEYESFLTEKQARACRLYYSEDLSLSEIAAEMEITRQGVSDTLTRARRRLYGMEDKLQLVHKKMEAETEHGI